jgi:hypothetical protein
MIQCPSRAVQCALRLFFTAYIIIIPSALWASDCPGLPDPPDKTEWSQSAKDFYKAFCYDGTTGLPPIPVSPPKDPTAGGAGIPSYPTGGGGTTPSYPASGGGSASGSSSGSAAGSTSPAGTTSGSSSGSASGSTSSSNDFLTKGSDVDTNAQKNNQ